MDQTVFVILLVSGFYIPSSSNPYVYHFVSERKNWSAAEEYCSQKYIRLASIDSMKDVAAMKNTPTGGYTGKAWIGLYTNTNRWLWLLKGNPKIYNWKAGEPDNRGGSEFCVTMEGTNGMWSDANCSDEKPFICFNVTTRIYSYNPTLMTWGNASEYCVKHESFLANCRHWVEQSSVQKVLPPDTEAWIGLARNNFWFWSTTKHVSEFKNWQTGQPDNMSGKETCAATVVKQGDWNDDDCSLDQPFFCYGIHKTQTIVVRMEIQSGANMEDPTTQAQLLQQLHAALANQGAFAFKLTWKIQTVNEKQ